MSWLQTQQMSWLQPPHHVAVEEAQNVSLPHRGGAPAPHTEQLCGLAAAQEQLCGLATAQSLVLQQQTSQGTQGKIKKCHQMVPDGLKWAEHLPKWSQMA